MTDQRDLAKEVEEIADQHAVSAPFPTIDLSQSACDYNKARHHRGVLLAFIASQSRELEELRKSLDHWKDCHGLTADRLAEAKSELAALRRPVVQQLPEMPNLQQAREWVERLNKLHGDDWSHVNPQTCARHSNTEAVLAEVDGLLSALDQAQREIQQLKDTGQKIDDELVMMTADRDRLQAKEQSILDLIAKCDDYRAEIARLSSPPEERGEIVERLVRLKKSAGAGYDIGSPIDDIDTLLQDLRRYSNAHKILLAERDEARKRFETERDVSGERLQRIERLEGALKLARKYAGCNRDCGGSEYRNGQRVACGCGFAEALPTIIAAATNSMVVTNENGRRSYVPLAAADGQQEETCEECGRGIPGDHHRAWVCNERTAATGDGVEGE